MNISIIHRTLALCAIVLACYAYFGDIREPQAYYMKVGAFLLILVAVVLRAMERRKERKN